MLESQPEIIFHKVPPYMVGDGIHEIKTLTSHYVGEVEKENPKRKEKILKYVDIT
jgi:hypothetical protein